MSGVKKSTVSTDYVQKKVLIYKNMYGKRQKVQKIS